MKVIVQDQFKIYKKEIDNFIDHFDDLGEQFGKSDRNKIKLFQLNDKTLNIKSFKIPNAVNQIIYRFFRKSKAQRSYDYANRLINTGFGTPQPIAYYEFSTFLLFKRSFYVSEHLECDLTYRELTKDLDHPNHEAILRAFTRFTFRLHEKGIHFLDHSPGNTLIKLNNGNYQFYLVDLNRMKFGPMDFKSRIKNFSRLTIHKSMVEVMSSEYAKCIDADYSKVFHLMWRYTQKFQEKHQRKRRIKKKLLFWKY